MEPVEDFFSRVHQDWLQRGRLDTCGMWACYGALIDGLYAGASEVDVEIPVTYQDGRTSQFKARVGIHDVDAAARAATAPRTSESLQ